MALTEAQIAARSKGIGASETAAVLGLTPPSWKKTAYQIWEDKVGLSTGVQEETPQMAYGKLMEPTLRQWYSNHTGRVVTVPEMALAHSKYPFILASPDGLSEVRRGVEIKTARSSQDWGEPGTDQIPVYYMTQVQQQMLVFTLEVVDVVVSFAGSMPEIYEVPADSEIQEMIIEELSKFWKLVQERTPPEPVSYADMLAMFGKVSKAAQVAANQEIMEQVAFLQSVKADMKRLEASETDAKAIIMHYLGDQDTLIEPDGKVLATWKMSKASARFDAKALQAADPESYNKYLKAGEPSRRFLLK